MENVKVSSIEKLNKQIDMLANEEFLEKTKKLFTKKEVKTRKVIQEEPTLTDINLLDNLMPDYENKTMVYGAKDLNKKVDLSFVSKIKKFVIDYLDTDIYNDVVENSLCIVIGTLIIAVIIFILAI